MGDIQQQVRDIVEELVGSGVEAGVQVAVYRHGEQVVDVAAGADATGRALTAGTPVFAQSVGKGVAATVVHVLAERGVFGYDTRITELWPEFGAHGKDRATIRDALTHTLGVPHLPAGTRPEQFLDLPWVCARIADTVPLWEPGTQCGYHAQTWGFIIAEIVRRATRTSISQLLADEVSGPLGVADELYFSVPAADLPRLATLDQTPEYAEMLAVFPTEAPAVLPSAELVNRPDFLAAGVPQGCVTSARAVARMYAALLGAVDGVRLVPPARLAELSAVAYAGRDVLMGMPTKSALGYGIGTPWGDPVPFGMPGIGGSAAYADVATGTAFALTSTRLHGGMAPAMTALAQLDLFGRDLDNL